MAARDVVVRIVERVENSGATKRVENDLRKLGPAGDVAAKGLDKITSALTSRLGTASGSAKKALDGVATSAISSGGAIGAGVAAGAAAAGLALANLAKNGVEAFLTLTAQARAVQRVTGATAEEASTLAAVMRHLGIDVDAGAVAFGKLEKTVGTNAKSLHDQGVEVQRNVDGSTNFAETLANISDAYNGTTDQAKRAAIASAAFGRGYITLIPLLSKSRAELRALGEEADKHHQVFDQSQLDAGKNLTLQLRSLHEASQGLEVNFAEGLVPQATDVAAGLTKVTEKVDSASSSIGGLGGIAQKALNLLPGGLGNVVNGLGSLGKSSGDAARKQAELAQDMADAEQAAKDEADALAADVKAIHDHVDAALSAGDAEDKLGTALQHLADVQADDHAADVAAANRDVSDALLAQESAANRLSDAQDHLNELKNRDITLELRRAQLADRRAKQNIEQSKLTEANARDALQRAKDIGASPREIAEAQEALDEATLGVDEANQAAADSAKAVKDLQNPQGTKEYRDAVLAVKEAQSAAAKATSDVADAEKKANDVRSHDNTADVTRATRDVQRAIEDVGKAGGTIDQQIAAYQRLFAIVPPQFRGFINDRIAELKALQYQAGLTKGQLEQLESIFAPITGAAPPPPGPKQPGVGAVIGGIVSGPTGPTAPLSTAPTGGVNAGPSNKFQSLTTWNVTVTDPDPAHVERYLLERQRLANLTRG